MTWHPIGDSIHFTMLPRLESKPDENQKVINLFNSNKIFMPQFLYFLKKVSKEILEKTF